MSRGGLLTWGFVAAGVLIGGLGGQHRFAEVHDPGALCPTCHFDDEALLADRGPVPHTVDYYSVCHTCHVVGLQPYVETTFATVGLDAPAWAEGLEDPVIGGLDCLGCHAKVGRAEIDCSICHTRGQPEVREVSRCNTCHTSKTPMTPHDRASCEDCHLETIANPQGMAKMLIEDNRRQREADRDTDRGRAGSTMGTKDLAPGPVDLDGGAP